MIRPLTMWVTTNCGKFFKRWEYQTTLPASWETCMHIKKQQLEPDTEQWTDSKLGKDYFKAIYYHPAYLIYIQSTSCKMLGWMKHKLESRLQGEISITSDMQMTPPLCKKQRGTTESLDESEREEWKSCLKTRIQKMKIISSGSITSQQIDEETMGTVRDFIFLGSRITEDTDCSH